MNEILTILNTFSPHLTGPTLKQMTLIVDAILSMTGRVTMLGLSRWTEKGGSYRTVQRFFKEKIDWLRLRWQLIKQHVQEAKGIWLLIGDEVMVTKSGKETHGLGIFFFDLQQATAWVMFFKLVIAVCRNADSLPFNNWTTGARRCPEKCAQGRYAQKY